MKLQQRMGAAGVSRSAVARAVKVRHNTVTELYLLDLHHLEDFRFVSIRTLAALCAHLETRLETVHADTPW